MVASDPEDPGGVWDPGLQPERTSLSWQRVNLGALGASLVSARLVIEVHPLIGYALAVLSVGVAALLTLLHGRRLLYTTSALHVGHRLPDGRLHLVVLAMLVLIAAAGMVFVIDAGA